MLSPAANTDYLGVLPILSRLLVPAAMPVTSMGKALQWRQIFFQEVAEFWQSKAAAKIQLQNLQACKWEVKDNNHEQRTFV